MSGKNMKHITTVWISTNLLKHDRRKNRKTFRQKIYRRFNGTSSNRRLRNSKTVTKRQRAWKARQKEWNTTSSYPQNWVAVLAPSVCESLVHDYKCRIIQCISHTVWIIKTLSNHPRHKHRVRIVSRDWKWIQTLSWP